MPPLVGVATKVTGIPEVEQIAVVFDVILTDGVIKGLTVIVILLLVAGFPVAQGVIFEVSNTVTTAPLLSAVVLYVELFVPKLLPLTFH